MQLYDISPKIEFYKQLIITEKNPNDEIKYLGFNGEAMIESWAPFDLRWITGDEISGPGKKAYDQTHQVPDIAHWYVGAMVLSPKAMSILGPLFKEEAEFLPVFVEGEEWTILNIINVQEVLDKANCRYHINSDGTVGWMKAAAFFKDKITNGKLFRVQGLNPDLFTSDVPGSFKEVVESNGLTGFEFDEC